MVLRTDFTDSMVAASVHAQHHNDLATAANGLDTRVSTLEDGTGWTLLTLDSAVMIYSGQDPGYRKIGNAVYLRGLLGPITSWSTGSTYTISGVTPIASGYRPPQARYFQIAAHTASASCRFIVNSNGTVQMTTGTVAPSYVDISSVFWLVN